MTTLLRFSVAIYFHSILLNINHFPIITYSLGYMARRVNSLVRTLNHCREFIYAKSNNKIILRYGLLNDRKLRQRKREWQENKENECVHTCAYLRASPRLICVKKCRTTHEVRMLPLMWNMVEACFIYSTGFRFKKLHMCINCSENAACMLKLHPVHKCVSNVGRTREKCVDLLAHADLQCVSN